MKFRFACAVAALLLVVPSTFAQTPAASALPRLVRFGGTVKDLNGNPMTGVVGITFALYSEQTGGAALWLETQNVTADANGHYVALLGSTKPDGLPTDLFTSEQARWVGVQISGQAEQPRVLLVSAPYALKAGDAETIGGLPPSAFVKATPEAGPSAGASAFQSGVTTTSSSAGAASAKPGAEPLVLSKKTVQTPSPFGTTNYVPLWTGATSTNLIANSNIYQSTSGATSGDVGISETDPSGPLHITGPAGAPPSGLSATHNGLLLGTNGTSSYKWIQSYGGPLAINPLGVNNVGIGTMAPADTLTVVGNGSFSNGVSGESSVVNAAAVTGGNSATSGSGTEGVYGYTSSPAGTGTVGVNFSTGGTGVAGASNGTGVYGQSEGTASASTGVYGNATAVGAVNPTYGVYGLTANNGAGSAGVYGYASFGPAVDGPPGIYGVYGVVKPDAYHAGTAGTGTTISSTGGFYSIYPVGVWGDADPTLDPDDYGVLGTADDSRAIVAINSTGTDTSTPALLVQNNSQTAKASVFTAAGVGTNGGQCDIDVNGDLTCTGQISQSVSTTEGRQVKLYGVASPENWFEDFGSGQLSGGGAKISLDPTFASIVNTGETYHVFLSPNGDCKGLYVASKTAGGFEVRELDSGASSISFDYRIVAKRRGYEKVRMEDTTEQMNKIRERQAEMQAKRSSVGPSSAPPRPVAPELTPRVPAQAQPARVSSLQTPTAPLK